MAKDFNGKYTLNEFKDRVVLALTTLQASLDTKDGFIRTHNKQQFCRIIQQLDAAEIIEE